MSKREKQEFIDDGRTIASMDVEGMPWHYKKGKSTKALPDDGLPELTREGNRALMRGVVLAALTIGAVFALGFLLFILFCVFVWFK